MTLLSEPPYLTEPNDTTGPPPRRTWRRKFRDACRGMKFGVRNQSSFFVHFFFTALVLTAAIVLHCTPVEWCLLLGGIGFVMVAELFNSAIEMLAQAPGEVGRA